MRLLADRALTPNVSFLGTSAGINYRTYLRRIHYEQPTDCGNQLSTHY